MRSPHFLWERAKQDTRKKAACALLLVVEKPMSPAFITGKTGTVLNVYTKLKYRRNGYARKLMNMLMDDALDMKLSVAERKATEDGYYARGEADESSGLDFLVYMAGKILSLHWFFACRGFTRGFEKDVDVFEINEINKDSDFYNAVMRERLLTA